MSKQTEQDNAETNVSAAGQAERCIMRREGYFLSPTQLSDYGSLVDDYNVSEVECEHIQAAARYGW